MMATVYGLGKTRITLYMADGTTPTDRYTLQREGTEGMLLTFVPVGVPTLSGASDNWGKRTNHKGFRPRLDVNWGYGTTCTKEIWNGAELVAAGTVATHVAVATIMNSSAIVPCKVEPRITDAYYFLAQPELEPFRMNDTKGIAYRNVALKLVGVTPGAIPAWGV